MKYRGVAFPFLTAGGNMALIFDHFFFRYDSAEREALQDIALKIDQGEFVVLVGSGGSGKSTLLQSVNGIIPGFLKGEMKGSVTVDGLNTQEARTVDLTQKVGMVFQNAEMQFFTTTVEEELALALENMGVPAQTILERIDWALNMTGMQDYRERPLYALSGGQKQLIAIASILVMRPNILLLGEPTANLDPAGSEKVYRVIEEVHKTCGATIILIDHKIDMILENVGADFRMIALKEGRVLADGTGREVLSNASLVNEIGLKVLSMVELHDALKTKGVDLPAFLSVMEGESAVKAWLKGRKQA